MVFKLNQITVGVTINDDNGSKYNASLKWEDDTAKYDVIIYDHQTNKFLEENNVLHKEISLRLVNDYQYRHLNNKIMKDKFKYIKITDEHKICPVCGSDDTREDYDFPETMRCCEKCGCDYMSEDGEIILDPRDIK